MIAFKNIGLDINFNYLNSRSSNSNSNINSNTNSSTNPLPLFNKPPTVASNASAQRHALELTQEAKSKIDEYKCLLIYTSDKDLRYQIYGKLKNTHETIAQKKKHFNLLQSHATA
ncbi:4613_t:CDS:2 [Dentiscutata heterogama]|uniref:4613_t:CDS:1 n=1 Tax=Dentiscutata heterogama TaxID=1316150 RepID=A0ACA9LM12_9GLOM|nr:4613_t:CDS:2 [Dentiscutata heterogama]